MTVRTRVAPSPTGDPHVGTAYMALFSMVFAHSQGGEFILRIEDTDAARSIERSEESILECLRWLGLKWDEGPDVGGPVGPYRQSERLDIYREHAEQLVLAGQAFPCFCSPERLAAMRREQLAAGMTTRYDGHCLGLSAAEAAGKVARGESHVVRLKVPDEGTCVFHDALRGEIEIDWSQVDMQVLMKADGYPTYHLAVVVDDHLMGITHILRGEEWINSAPKHVLLYQYFDWPMPDLIHLNLLRNPDKSKLSKRKNPTSIGFYRDMGIMPEALLNYLGMMGWSLPSGEEKFTLEEMQEAFDVTRISLGSPVFDLEKLLWLNGRWLRDLGDEALADRLVEWALNRDRLLRIIPLIKERVEAFGDVVPMIQYLYAGVPALDEGAFQHKQLGPADMKKILQFALWRLEQLEDWQRDAIQGVLAELAKGMGLKLGTFLAPLFIAISGRPVSPPLFDSLAILGPDLSRARLRAGIAVLGGVSNRESKRLGKEFEALGTPPAI